MYQSTYKEIQNSSSNVAKQNEVRAIDHSIELMKLGQKMGMRSKEAIEAQFFLNRLWIFFIEDLSSSENCLTDELKGEIISIGIWILRETERTRRGESESFRDIIQVSQTIRDGLQ